MLTSSPLIASLDFRSLLDCTVHGGFGNLPSSHPYTLGNQKKFHTGFQVSSFTVRSAGQH